MEYKIYKGEKTETIDGVNYFYFYCDPDDIDTAYDALCENLKLAGFDEEDYDFPTPEQKQIILDFQDLKDDDVETMLKDAEQKDFISDFEIKDKD